MTLPALARDRMGLGPVPTLARLVLLLTVVLPMVMVVTAAPASAAPAPSPSATPPACAPPQTYPQGAGPAGASAVNWCVPWARYVPSQGWQTVCSKAVAVDEQAKCDAVSLTVDIPPRDGTASVLADDRPGGTGNPTGSVVRCGLFAKKAKDDAARATQWTGKEQRCELVRASLEQRSSSPPSTGCGLDPSCHVTKNVEKAVRSGFQGLVDLTVQGYAQALGWLAQAVFTYTPVDADDAFYSVYNDIAGILVILVMLYFIFSASVSALRTGGPGPVASLLGLLRAILGITFAGGIAFTLVAAWDEATRLLIARNISRDWRPGVWVEAVEELTGDAGTILLGFIVALFSLFGLVLLFVMLLFRSLLAAAAALFGGMAMAGQAMGQKSHARTWFWTVNALAASKFFIAGLWLYGSRLSYGGDMPLDSLQGLLIIWVMVLAPGVLLRLTTIWDGYVADVNAGSMLSAATTAIGLDAMLDRVGGGGGGGGGGGSGGSGGGDAAALMDGDIATTPAAAAGAAPGPMHDAAQAAQQNSEGEPVGTPPTGASSETANSETAGSEAAPDTGGRPNAAEAEGVQADTDKAGQDAASGALHAPGDATGPGSSVPVTPGAVQEQAGQPAAAGIGGESATPGAETPDPGSSGVPAGGADPGASSPGGPASGTDPVSGVGAGGGDVPGGGAPSAEPGAGPGSGPGGGGAGSGGAAGVAADIPPIPPV